MLTYLAVRGNKINVGTILGLLSCSKKHGYSQQIRLSLLHFVVPEHIGDYRLGGLRVLSTKKYSQAQVA